MDILHNKYPTLASIAEEEVKNYGLEAAARNLSVRTKENLDFAYAAGILLAKHLQDSSMTEYELLTKYPSLFNQVVRQYILDHYEELSQAIFPDRDFTYQYRAIKTIASNYLFKVEGKPKESLQWSLMRMAVQVSVEKDSSVSLQEVLNNYEIFSSKEATHATPTWVNAGFHRAQLESCFLVPVGDSMDQIQAARTLVAMGSKANGGFGLDCGRIRHSRVSNRGQTKGVPGLLKFEFNPLLSYADQLGSRPGACTAFLPIWHIDIYTFSKMGDRKSAESIRADNLNYSIWVQDLFMKRRLEDGMWHLFCPRSTQILWAKLHGLDFQDSKVVDKCPSLHDMWGINFEKFYLLCEQHLVQDEDPNLPAESRTTWKANELWAYICEQRCRRGQPFIMYGDACNRKSNQQHMGTITQSNLCQEITQYTKPGEQAATCDLATVNLAALAKNGKFDFWRLGVVTRQLVRNLNRVLDATSGILDNTGQKLLDQVLATHPKESAEYKLAEQMYPHVQKDPTYTARMQNRAIGIGKMGLASVFMLLGLEYTSTEAVNLATQITACIYWHSVDESHKLALRDGSYPTFEGSPMSKGILQPDMWMQETEDFNQYLDTLDKKTVEKLGMSDYIKRFNYKLVDPTTFGVNDTWDNLRDKCKLGMRNSLLTCQMPNVTTSAQAGVTPSVEPIFSVLYSFNSVNGKDDSFPDAFRDVMQQHGLYDPVKLAEFLFSNKGDARGMSSVFQGEKRQTCKKLEGLFTRAYDINKKKYFLMVQKMGYYICQSQSLNWYFELPSDKYMAELDTLLWINGAKNSQYYIYRKASADSISVTKTDIPAVEQKSEQSQEVKLCNRFNKDCIACQQLNIRNILVTSICKMNNDLGQAFILTGGLEQSEQDYDAVAHVLMISRKGLRIIPADGMSEKQLQEMMDLIEKKTGQMILSIRQYSSGLINRRHPQFRSAVEIDVLVPNNKEKKTLIYTLDDLEILEKKCSIPDLRDSTSDVEIYFEE